MSDEEKKTRRRAYQNEWARRKRAEDPEAVRAKQRETERARSAERAAWKRAYRLANIEHVQALGRAAQRKAVDKRREIVSGIKTTRGCADCGFNAHLAALDFDHLDPKSKSKSVSWLVSHNAPMQRILDEIEKCEVVCANCHRIRTYERRDWEPACLPERPDEAAERTGGDPR
ncbi:hypothetical protein [Streptomyces zaomyceticus]|uniref:hypothetical protein n=1 Tax=Streptomyces zaomyceticus TaxID=68286 RepID=UPI0037AEE526